MDEMLNSLIVNVREMMAKRELRECEKIIRQAMSDYPDNAIPHNLMGLLYEKKGDHLGAMKHFRAACTECIPDRNAAWCQPETAACCK